MTNTKSRRLAAIMFTDIVGYTAMMQEDEAKAINVRTKHRKTFEQYHVQHSGEILQYYGDGTLSIFQSGVEAVACAIAIQQAFTGENAVPLRIGIHIGDIIADGTEVYGDGVNVAARVESLSAAGSVLISGKLNEELHNQKHISTISLGYFDFKNVAAPVEVFAVNNDGIVVPNREGLQGKQKAPQFTVAVLPLVNMSPDQDTEYFSDGMTEEIINALAKIKPLKVTSRTSSFHFKGKNLPITQIGKELNVAIILEGSIRLSKNRMRLTAQLIDVAEDFHFWSETFDRTIDDIFEVQDEISLLIADKLREHIGHFELDEELVKQQQVKIDAYQQYLKGRFHILKMSREDILIGISMMEEVIEAEPEFALAYIGAHLGYTMMGALGLSPGHEAFAKAGPFLEKALALDSSLPECQINLSHMTFLQDWDFEATYQHLSNAFEIKPTVEYYQGMAGTLSAEGRLKAAGEHINTALQLDPFSPINYHLRGYIYYLEENFEEAIHWYEKSMQGKANFLTSTLELGQAMLLAGRHKQALEYFEGLPEKNAKDLTQIGGITLCQAMIGDDQRAFEGVKVLEEALKSELMEKAINLLVPIYTQLRNEGKALDLLDQAIEIKLPLILYFRYDPLLKPLYQHPRFVQQMEKIYQKSSKAEPGTSRRYKKSLLEEGLLITYKDKLTKLMEEERPYLSPVLSLRDLADQLGLSPNHLSQLLNEGFDKNFSEFVNGYRLEEFKAKVANDSLQHLTLLALAYDSGFNSKTVFNTYFKKAMGMTPKAYLKSVRFNK